MAGTLTVWKFPSETGADTALHTLKELQSEELITVHDAALVTWPAGAKKPKTRQLNNVTGFGALNGAFWGMLFGLLFFVPLLGAAFGALGGAIGGALTDVGIDDDFIDRVKKEVTPGTSALFALTSGAVADRVHDRVAGQHGQLIASNLSAEQEAKLREAFAD